MTNTVFTRLQRISWPILCFSLLLLVLNACSDASTPTTTVTNAPPPVWTNYQSNVFTMNYFSNWNAATKDFYLGTHYPPLEMLQGEVFTRSSTTFLQVAYAPDTNNKGSAKDIMLKFLLNSSTAPATTASLSKITLAKETWYQGSIAKQATQSNGEQVQVKETVLGIDRKISSKSTEVYLIFYQDSASTYAQNTQSFFQRMVNSFQFAS